LRSFFHLPQGHAILVKSTDPPIEIAAVDAFMRMVVLTTGKPVHLARQYQNTPSVLDLDNICVDNLYQQWVDVLNVLSEYNSREDVLSKYLTIYHVIENFMYKLPIVGLERQQSGRMFSIRDFRRLYKKVEIAESDALKQLFVTVFQMEALLNKTFEQHIAVRWSNLLSCVTEEDIDKALFALDLTFKFNTFQEKAAACFSKLVYAIRNAIVHNKETEFHLTYASLDPMVCSLIELFLIPSLEEICFALISTPNTQLWYQNKELRLYT
jgi:hypothetical protein